MSMHLTMIAAIVRVVVEIIGWKSWRVINHRSILLMHPVSSEMCSLWKLKSKRMVMTAVDFMGA